MSLKNSRYGFFLGLLIGALCLGLAVRSVDPQELWHTFSRLDSLSLFLALGLALLHAFAMALKWQLFLRPLGPQKFWNCFWSVRLGFFFNAILPAKLGEGIRLWFMQKNGGVPFSQGIGALVADRFIDFAGLVLVFYFSMNFISVDSSWVPKEVFALIFFGFALIFIGLNFLPENKGPLWIQKVVKFLHQVRRGLDSLIRPKILLPGLSVAMVGWFIHIAMVMILARGLGLTLEWPQTMVVIAAVTLVGALPSAPSSLGTFEFAAVFVLTRFFKVAPEEALALALLYHFVQLGITWSVGFIGYVRYHSSLMPEIKRLKRSA